MKRLILFGVLGLALSILGPFVGCGDDDGEPGGDGGGGTGGARCGDGAATRCADPGDAAGGADGAAAPLASSQGSWTIYADPYGDGRASPIAQIAGAIQAHDAGGGKTRFSLAVTQLPALRDFGAHLHVRACDDMKAGGHYQHALPPDGGSAADPAFANAMNEVWLDFKTDGPGNGASQATVSFVPRAGQAKAVVIHDMKTGDGGVAGAKLACISMPF